MISWPGMGSKVENIVNLCDLKGSSRETMGDFHHFVPIATTVQPISTPLNYFQQNFNSAAIRFHLRHSRVEFKFLGTSSSCALVSWLHLPPARSSGHIDRKVRAHAVSVSF